MNQILPNIGTTGNEKFTELLAKTFVCDMLYPVFGESSVTTIFQGWQGELNYNWSRFTNEDGDILEFFAEGQYVIRARNESKNGYQLKTPRTIKEFIEDMNRFGIQLRWNCLELSKSPQMPKEGQMPSCTQQSEIQRLIEGDWGYGRNTER